MTKENWTRGPWTRVNDSVYAKGSVDTYSGVVMGGIASVDSTNQEDEEGRNWSTSGCKEANCDLMAAAPELYEALKKALHLIAEKEGTSDGNDAIYGAAKAALSKARGEQ